jgi:chromosomal replication initiator protein
VLGKHWGLRDQLGKQNYETWIQPIVFVSRDKGCVYLNVPNKFFRDWLTEHYLTRLEEVLSKTAQQKLTVSLDVKQEPQIKIIAEKNVGKDEREREKRRRTSNLIPRYTFENFVIGASNQFAHAASMAVANQPGDHYNPLFI